MTVASDTALLDAWRAGDTQAGNALLARHFRSLLRFFENKAGPEADDLIQRTLLACAESYQAIRGDASFRTYLFAIARNELHRFFRQRSAQRDRIDFGVSSLCDLRTSASAQIQQKERRLALEQALAQLPLDDQLMLELHYSEELDSRELSQVFGIEPGSIRARMHRARAALERLLAAASA